MTTYVIGYLKIRNLKGHIVKNLIIPEDIRPAVLFDGSFEKFLGTASNIRVRNHLILADTDVEIPEGYKVTFGGIIEEDGTQRVGYLMVVPEWAWGDLPNSLDEFNQKCCTLCNYSACMFDCNTPVARVEN